MKNLAFIFGGLFFCRADAIGMSNPEKVLDFPGLIW